MAEIFAAVGGAERVDPEGKSNRFPDAHAGAAPAADDPASKEQHQNQDQKKGQCPWCMQAGEGRGFGQVAKVGFGNFQVGRHQPPEETD